MKNIMNGHTTIRLSRLGRSAGTALSGLAMGLGTAWATITPAFAASWPSALADIDWRSYLDWHTYTGWRGVLLAGSVALLIAAVLIRATRDAGTGNATRVPVRNDLLLRRVGTMPIEPPESLEGAR